MKKQSLDNSPYVFQRNKLKEKLNIRELKWTPKQQEFIGLALNKKTRIIYVSGPAGSAKTFLSVYVGLKLLSDKTISDLIYIRSAVESSDSKLGYLPGPQNLKMQFYGEPFMDKLEELLPTQEVKFLVAEERVSVQPTNFARGKSWNGKCFILDESQNSSIKEIETIVTRLGHFSKCFILADPTQTDLKNGARGGFQAVSNGFDSPEWKERGVHVFRFDKSDIVRDELLKSIVEQFEKIKSASA